MGSRKDAPNRALKGLSFGQDWKDAAQSIRKFPKRADEMAAKDLPNRVRFFRSARGYSQQKLGEMTGANIGGIERGAVQTTIPDLLRIAAALEVRPEVLLAVTSGGGAYLVDAYERAGSGDNRKAFTAFAQALTDIEPPDPINVSIDKNGMRITDDKQ